MHTIVNYPSDTNRITKLVMPEGDLNGSAAALNASIKALTDAITAAQAVLATLVPYTGATANVNLGTHSISAGTASVAGGAITLGNTSGTAAYINSDGSASFNSSAGAIQITPANDGSIDAPVIADSTGNFTIDGNGQAAFNLLGSGAVYLGLGDGGYLIATPDLTTFLIDNAGNIMSGGAVNAASVDVGSGQCQLNNDGSALFGGGSIEVDSSGNLAIGDAHNISLGATTGTKIAGSTSQKLAFWNKTPIVQPTTSVAGATFTANSGTAVNSSSTFDGYTIAQVVKALRDIGLLS